MNMYMCGVGFALLHSSVQLIVALKFCDRQFWVSEMEVSIVCPAQVVGLRLA